jgi:hypothetical protein
MRKVLALFAVLFALLTSAATMEAAVCDVTHGIWSARASSPTPVVRAWGAYFPDNGRFYVLGGRSADGAGNDLLNPREYDPVADAWATKTASFADTQVNNLVGGVLDFAGTRLIVLVGGSAGGATTATAEVRYYDPIADTMTTATTDPWPGIGAGNILPGGAAVHQNKLYVFGGFQINTGMEDAIWVFDPALSPGARWQAFPEGLLTSLGYIPAASVGNFLYTLGGSSWDGVTLVDSSFASQVDPVGGTLASVAALPRATGETRAVAQTDGTIWVLSGGRTVPNPTPQVDIYDPVGDSWTTGPALPTARRNFAADVDPVTGDVFAVGGYDVSGVTPLAVNETLTCVIFVDGFESSSTSAWSVTVP